MTKESFTREILARLSEQRCLYPAMNGQDVVKFVFQGMLGVGHLLSSREKVEEYIVREMDPLVADPTKPLTEMLSPAWCRLSLRAAKGRGLSASVIAGLMLYPAASPQFTRQDVLSLCAELAASGREKGIDPELLGKITDDAWLPSHSSVYREQYHPAYRVISAGWLPCLGVIQRIAALSGERILITIDGPCASGKSTFASKLADVFSTAVVHTDEYVIPHAQKTPERLALPGGNCDSDRLAREVVVPWKLGKPVVYRRYDCRKDLLLPEEQLPDCRILILEGSYCNLPVIRQYADLRIFMDVPPEVRMRRLSRRESSESLQRFHDRWIPLENSYFEFFALPDRNCEVLSWNGE